MEFQNPPSLEIPRGQAPSVPQAAPEYKSERGAHPHYCTVPPQASSQDTAQMKVGGPFPSSLSLSPPRPARCPAHPCGIPSTSPSPPPSLGLQGTLIPCDGLVGSGPYNQQDLVSPSIQLATAETQQTHRPRGTGRGAKGTQGASTDCPLGPGRSRTSSD